MRLRVLLILILIISFLSGCNNMENESTEVQNEENIYSGSCPRSIVDCEYPGECGLYVDENHNDICDRSE